MNEKIYKNKEEWQKEKGSLEEDNIGEECGVCGEPHGEPCMAAGPRIRIKITMNEVDTEITTGDEEAEAERALALSKVDVNQVTNEIVPTMATEIGNLIRQRLNQDGMEPMVEPVVQTVLAQLGPEILKDLKKEEIIKIISKEIIILGKSIKEIKNDEKSARR